MPIWASVLLGASALAFGIALFVQEERTYKLERTLQAASAGPVEIFNWSHAGLDSILSGDLADGTRIQTSPIFLVSQNGKRVRTNNDCDYLLC